MLTSPRLALAVLMLISVYTGTASWFPWVRSASPAPAWAQAAGLDHPFTAIPFLLLIPLLFISTAACTLKRLRYSRKLYAGDPAGQGIKLPVAALVPGWETMLLAQAYRNVGNRLYKRRWAFFSGPVLHIGLLVVLAGVTVQQGFQESGSFELAEGEMVRLDAETGVMDRTRGPFAPKQPPALEIGLDSFDPFFRQAGYAPDRLSKLLIRDHSAGLEKQATLDRAKGVKVGATEIFHAIPNGLALKMEIAGMGLRMLHLREMSPTTSAGTFTAPDGSTVRFVVQTERSLYDPLGTGEVSVRLESPYQTTTLMKGMPFLFGTEPAKITAITRWAGFTYSRSFGTGVIFTGFSIILLGSFLLLFSSGVATVTQGKGGEELSIYQNRGQKELLRLLAESTGSPLEEA